MRFRYLTLFFAFALSFHAEIAWAGGTDCVDMENEVAHSGHAERTHSDQHSESHDENRPPECPTAIHHIAACSVMGVAAGTVMAADQALSGQAAVFAVVPLLDRLPASLPSPPPWV